MLIAHFFDLIPIWALLIGTILVMVLFIEFGFRLGKNAQAGSKKAQTAQVRAIMGAGLGLLAFMLAFTFATAQSHFEARVHMQADLLTEPRRSQAKRLLRDYVQLRSDDRTFKGTVVKERLADLLQQSEQIQAQLWALAAQSHQQTKNKKTESKENDLFMVSILALTDIHYTRVHSAIMNRIPFTIWMTLYLMAILSMIIMGYQAGLTDRRSPVATMTLAVAFSAVIILITDLDRPIMSFFDINKQLLVDLSDYMEADLRLEYYPGEQKTE